MKWLNRWICLLTKVWRVQFEGLDGRHETGCSVLPKQVHAGCTVMLGTCEVCGTVRVRWHHGDPNPMDFLEPWKPCVCLLAKANQ